MSPLHALFVRLVRELGPRAARVAWRLALAECTTTELAAAAYDWRGLWARPDQLSPEGTWRASGALQGRGAGKSRRNVETTIEAIIAGHATRIALIATSELKTVEIFVTGASGFLACTPPWLGVQWEASANRLVFGNGAVATLYSAETPEALRGPEHDWAVASELGAWAASTREESFRNLRLGLRLSPARLLWDCTPKKRNPLIRQLLKDHEANPEQNRLLRGASESNAINLAPGLVAEWRAMYSGTQAREELDAVYLDDSEDQIVKQAWIDGSRRGMPESFKRRVVSVDPAGTSNARSDGTGIVCLGAGPDGDAYVTDNLSGKHPAEVWPGMIVDYYTRNRCDLILCETNKGNDLLRVAFAAVCRERGLTLQQIGETEKPAGRSDVVYYRPITARASKLARMGVAAGHIERGHVHFVAGRPGMTELENQLCDFTGEQGRRDDAADALSAGVVEVADMAIEPRFNPFFTNKPGPSGAPVPPVEPRTVDDYVQHPGRVRSRPAPSFMVKGPGGWGGSATGSNGGGRSGI